MKELEEESKKADVVPNIDLGSAAKSEDLIWITNFDKERQTVVNRFRFLVITQFFILWSMGRDAFNDDYYLDRYKVIPSIAIIFSRYLCVAFLHIKLAPKIN